MNRMKFICWTALTSSLLLISPAPAEAASCDSLASLALPNATITMAQVVGEGALTMQGIPRLPAFCRVAATLRPTADSDIKIEVWLPASGWNGKFQGVGNGGWAGSINYADMADALVRGYATASTDTGHSGDGGAFVMGHPEKLIDYGYRAIHEMTVHSKTIIDEFYGRAPQFSIFNACSTGGRQGLVEAQRFPQDYDGIIAGHPANPRPRLSAWQLSVAKAILADPASQIPRSKYAMIHQAVLGACDAIDGLKDGLIDNPAVCKFDPKVLECKPGAASDACLTPPQVESARRMTTGPRDPKTGVELFPALAHGTELGWATIAGGPEPRGNAYDHFRFVVFSDPNWDWRTFNLETDLPRAERIDNGLLNATNPDLSRFSQRGGKLLMYHGWSDQNIPPQATINYYSSVLKTMGGFEKTGSWLRLFMAPGMAHCGGGEGPNTFDAVGTMEQWLEKGVTPDRIVASKSTGGRVERTRPLCAYPQVARYKGTGSIDDAVNFECRQP